MNIDQIMKDLAEYIRMGEQISATVDGLKDQLKQIMRERNTALYIFLKGGDTVYIILFFLLLPFMVLSECVKKNK